MKKIWEMNQAEFLDYIYKKNYIKPKFLIDSKESLDSFLRLCKKLIPNVEISDKLAENKFPFILEISTDYEYEGCKKYSHRNYYYGRMCSEDYHSYYRYIKEINAIDDLNVLPNLKDDKDDMLPELIEEYKLELLEGLE
jgi:hypothetical protein